METELISDGNDRGTISIMISSTFLTHWLWQVNTMQLLQKLKSFQEKGCSK